MEVPGHRDGNKGFCRAGASSPQPRQQCKSVPVPVRRDPGAAGLPRSQWEFRCSLCHRAWPSEATRPLRLFSHSCDCFSQLLLPVLGCKHITAWFTVQNIHPEFTSSFVFGLLQHLQLKGMAANYFRGKYIYIWGWINISHSGHPEMSTPL